jgi:hypothetical protein
MGFWDEQIVVQFIDKPTKNSACSTLECEAMKIYNYKNSIMWWMVWMRCLALQLESNWLIKVEHHAKNIVSSPS